MSTSRRGRWPAPSPEAIALDQLSAAIDLTCSNPSEVGLVHDEAVLAALADPQALRYAPDPLGIASARASVCEYYAARGVTLDIDRVALCCGTSEAYSQWMWLTADPGDVWCVPQPGYPLLDVLAQLAGVELRGYPLRWDGRWSIDLHALASSIDARTRAIVAVAPGNPTGSYLGRTELDAIAELCAANDLLLVVDEVFADHAIDVPGDRVRHVAGPLPCACVVLSGLSKVAALPQLKLAWSAWHGPQPMHAAWWDGLAHVADAWLSVATPVQLALPTLFAAGDAMRARIDERLRSNLATARRIFAGTAIDVLPVEGGWTLLLRLPALFDDHGWAIALARDADVRVHAGWLFELATPPRVVISLLTSPEQLAIGLDAIAQHVASVLR
ncbi:MAG TPA: pyridoxal phosphate-dependent aminotransferase [Nannocystaceae bacterium]|nr:pyridoxal phosphate-dependent aminotransferase [Nannocystaceae bacterium]